MVLYVRRFVAGYAVGRLLVDAAAVERRHRLRDDELRAGVLRRKIGPDLVVIVVAQEIERAGVKDGVLRTAVVGGLRDRPCEIERAHDSGELARNRGCGAVAVRPLLHHFVADAPHEHAGMIAVAQHHVREVAHVPGVPIEMVVVLGLFFLPHIEGFVQHDETHPVGQVEQLGRRWVVRRAYRVDAHRPHDLELPFDRTRVHGRTQGAQIVMQADAADLHVTPVQEES